MNSDATFRSLCIPMMMTAMLAVALGGCGRGEEPAAEQPPPPAEASDWKGACGHLEIADIGAIDIAPQLREKVDPALESIPVEGTVLFETILDAEGNVCDVRLRKGVTPELDAAAEQAIRQWKFAPALRGGQPVAVRYLAAVPFEHPGKRSSEAEEE